MAITLQIVFLLLPVTIHCDYTNKINPGTTFGVWEGWGTSLAWWANVYGDQDIIADLFFSTKTVTYRNQSIPGLGLNIARYNLGGCSSTTIGSEKMVASSSIPHYKQIEGFWLNGNSDDPSSASWNWNADKIQRDMVTKAIQRGADKIELFSNSPMWWMLKNHNPSGASDNGENLDTAYFEKFAIYLAAVAKYASQHWNVTYASVEPFNEGSSKYWHSTGSQEGCNILSASQQKVIDYLRSELDKRDLKSMIIAASDETSVDVALTTWNSFPAATKQKVGRVNAHGYGGLGGKRDQLYAAVHKDGKAIWNSEFGDTDNTGYNMAANIQYDFYWLHNTAWVYWQVLDENENWSTIQAQPSKATTTDMLTRYYVLAQYTRHIIKGMSILQSENSESVAAYDKAKHLLVIVTLCKDKAESITFDLSLFSEVTDGPVKRWTTNTAGGDKYVLRSDLTVKSKSLTVHLDAKTIQTVEISNVVI